MQNKTASHAFSLVEMLMALLVASLLLAALAPVMTKRTGGETLNVTEQGAQKPISSCVLVNDGKEDIEKECIVPNDVTFASAIIVSGGAGGAGAMSSVEGMDDWKLLGYVSGNDDTSDGTSSTFLTSAENLYFDKNTSAIKFKISGSGAGGGGGNYNTIFGPSADTCKNYGTGKTDTTGHKGSVSAPLTAYDSANKLCVTRYNQKVSSKCDNYTGGSFTSTPLAVCSHAGAVEACMSFSAAMGETTDKWVVPSQAQQGKWTAAFVGSTAITGLAGCDVGSTSALYCPRVGSYAYFIWSSTLQSGTGEGNSCYHGHTLSNGATANGSWLCDYSAVGSYTDYASVRCARGGEYLYYTGGGASSGSYLEIEVPQKAIKHATKSGKGQIKMHAQNGGKSGAKGAAGIRSGYENWGGIYDSSNTYVYAITVYAGYAGAAASTTANGTAGKPIYLETCWTRDITNDDYETNGYGASPACGEVPGVITYKKGNPGNGITGGASVWPGGGGYGAGGNGGTCELGSDNSPVCTAGTGGKGGRVEVYHKYAYPGAGGSGGNAGSFLHIKNIRVNAGDKIKIQAGKAGTGGAANSSGTEGGNSFAEFANGKKYEVIGGKAALDGILANPALNTFAQSGDIHNITANDIITPATRALLNDGDELYPNTTEEIAQLKGSKAQQTTDIDTQRLSGGNGGVNPKISGLAGVRGVPCGGYSTTPITINKIKYECGTNKQLSSVNYTPTPLYRALTEEDLRLKVSNYIHNYAPGGTGGGGGAWSNNYSDTSEKTGQGQDGMGGYVILYFQ